MTIDRRQFARLSALALGAAALPAPRLFSAAAAGRFATIRRGVGTFVLEGGTIGWLMTADAAVVVDAQMPKTAPACVAGLKAMRKPPFDALVNTHHHGDHTGGNGVFRPVVRHIVAQENVPGLQKAAAERRGTLDAQVYADVTFATAWQIDLGPETVRAEYRGPAHTGGDAVVHFVNADVVHVGDLVFNRWYPFIDRPGGASVRGWITALEHIASQFGPGTVYIFGHGSPRFGITGSRADILVQRDFFTALLEHVERGLKAGRSRAEITAATSLPGFPDHESPVPFLSLPNCLGVAYDELTATTG